MKLRETRIKVVKSDVQTDYRAQYKLFGWWSDFDEMGSFAKEAFGIYEFGSFRYAKCMIDSYTAQCKYLYEERLLMQQHKQTAKTTYIDYP